MCPSDFKIAPVQIFIEIHILCSPARTADNYNLTSIASQRHGQRNRVWNPRGISDNFSATSSQKPFQIALSAVRSGFDYMVRPAANAASRRICTLSMPTTGYAPAASEAAQGELTDHSQAHHRG